MDHPRPPGAAAVARPTRLRRRGANVLLLAALCGSVFAAGSAALPTAAHAASAVALASGKSLTSGKSVASPNGEYTLIMRTDGNLAVVDSKGDDTYYTHTGTSSGAHVTMDTSGDLVVRSTSGATLWQSHTGDYSGAQLLLRDDGNLALVSGTTTIWDTGWMQSVGGSEDYAKVLFTHYGWNVSTQYPYLNKVWGTIESGWRWNVCNGGSTYPSCDYTGSAYGIPQADPGSKMSADNPDWATDGLTQVAWGLSYISRTYGTPEKAYEHEESSCSDAPCGYAAS